MVVFHYFQNILKVKTVKMINSTLIGKCYKVINQIGEKTCQIQLLNVYHHSIN